MEIKVAGDEGEGTRIGSFNSFDAVSERVSALPGVTASG
jgi:hypothetical protein